MWHAFLHWLNEEYWSLSWPNIFAPSIWTLLGLLIADIRHRRAIERIKLHPPHEALASVAGQIEELGDKLVELLGGTHGDDHK